MRSSKFVLKKDNNIHLVEPEHDFGVPAQKMRLFLKKKGFELYILYTVTVTIADFFNPINHDEWSVPALKDIFRQKPKENLHL